MSYVPPTDDPVDADRIVGEVFGELANLVLTSAPS